MTWKQGQGLPHDGWFDGNVDLMIEWGTYADYRPRIVERVQDGFYGLFKDPIDKKISNSKKLLKSWDEKWEKIPIEDRMKKRQVIVDAVTPRREIRHTVKGDIPVEVSTPSGKYREVKRRNDSRKKATISPQSGSVTEENNPLISTQPE